MNLKKAFGWEIRRERAGEVGWGLGQKDGDR